MTGASRLRVTPHEFMHHVRPALSNRGFTEHQINQVEATFHSSLIGDPNHPMWKAGVDKKTLDTTLDYMSKHPSTTAVGPHHWDVVREVMEHNINVRR
jgi:hypothetical protein